MLDDALFLGIDGGGSRCRSRLRDARGGLLASQHGGSANVYLDFDGALVTLKDLVAATLREAGLAPKDQRRLHIGLGLAGVSSPAIAGQVETGLGGYARVRVTNDAVTACLGAHAGADGGLVIAGTGSAGLARVAGVNTFVGGRGFVLGDDGSGARIGLEAWRRALRAFDGLEPETDLTRRLMSQFGNDPVAVIRWGLRAKSSDYGATAPVVFAAGLAGDPVALSVLRAAGRSLADLAFAVNRLGAERIALVGGIADAIRPYLPDGLGEKLSSPRLDAVEGAILLVGGTTPLMQQGRNATQAALP